MTVVPDAPTKISFAEYTTHLLELVEQRPFRWALIGLTGIVAEDRDDVFLFDRTTAAKLDKLSRLIYKAEKYAQKHGL